MNPTTRSAVFLDRDGVINRSVVKDGRPYPPQSVEELVLLPLVPEALTRLKNAGFLLIGVTNQPDVARGTQKRRVVEDIHTALRSKLPLDDILTCFHDDQDGCLCRKPQAGLLLQAAEQYHIDLSSSFMVGDRWRDIEAGHNAGCRTVLIDYAYAEKPPKIQPHLSVPSLFEAVDWILDQAKFKEMGT
ncbi:MAG: HAD family hydrolase [Deltaproteobacteria bacterium]|nr:HAD family hydrolase [Deltaproteobacteria bacterium]MBF0525006.1 HAD family hydrolase [Deltaproteobacteria bacterium]